METVTHDDLRQLLEAFATASFRPKDCEKSAVLVQDKCVQLFKRDFPESILVNNTNGELSTSYPLSIVIPRKRPEETASAITTTGDGKPEVNVVNAGDVDAGKMRELMLKARVARCRARFPVPVILWNGKYVCRSATLSGGPEIYGRSGFDLLFPSSTDEDEDSCESVSHSSGQPSGPLPPSLPSLSSLSLSDSSQVFSKVRAQDINLLKTLGVQYICDLMVEKKKVKFGVYITSSEKADKEGRYSDFEILSMPYPGCEFFKEYRDKGYAGEGLVFDWSQHFVDAELDVPQDTITKGLDINWKDYKTWDIITLTKNYLRLFLRYLICSKHSFLVHCISGWDRTPLFISLLRLTLWADGKIHQSLNALEMTFLTLAYDWYLFGHNLNDRICKGEEILFFCFYFLQYITSDDFSVDAIQDEPRRMSQTHRSNQSLESHLDIPIDVPSEDVVDAIHPSGHSGSCTSLNSTTSSTSLRSQESVAQIPEGFCCIKRVSISSYPNTPPTLTNSEDGPYFLAEADAVDSIPNPSSEHLTKDSGICNCSIEDTRRSPSLKSSSKTTPMPIPASIDRRKSSVRLEESWQFVSENGSFKDSPKYPNFNSPDSYGSSSSCHSRKNGHAFNGHTGETSPRFSRASMELTRKAARKDRLLTVRNIFNKHYSSVMGSRAKNSTEAKANHGLSVAGIYQHLGFGAYAGRVTAQH